MNPNLLDLIWGFEFHEAMVMQFHLSFPVSCLSRRTANTVVTSCSFWFQTNQIRKLVNHLGRSFFLSRLFDLEVCPEFGSGDVIEKVRVLPRLSHDDLGVDDFNVQSKVKVISNEPIIWDYRGFIVATKASPVLGCSSVELLETQTCLGGPQVSLNVWVFGVVLESDAVGVIKLFTDRIVPCIELGAIMNDCLALTNIVGLASAIAVRRGVNSVAHSLAKLAFSLEWLTV
ncbi:hypothetical protein Ddye_004646 [Dipteronia dyeriana]|uniref:RNase H type-1 domain-containing protein n=1 Tax=Dipteronia dyeriana TaxID=168575 RepID=A0AAE0CWF2_9ROSI|nr:hypothetical protein Ddye_004646 [Dipteronia dyeriana]